MEVLEKKLNNRLVLFVLFLLGFLIYSNVINGPFLFDDTNFVVFNKYVHSLSNFFNYFTSSLEAGAALQLHIDLHNNFYRPVQQLAHGIIYQFFGLKVQAYHILSILLHIINSFLVFLLLNRLSFSRTGSFLASLIFLVHPVQVEAVSYISGVSDPLGFMFLVSGILVYLNCYDPNNKIKTLLKSSLAVILFTLAVLSKESAFIFCLLAILPSIFLWKNYSKKERSFRIINLVLYLILACIYVYLRLTVLNFSNGAFGLLANQDSPYVQYLYVRIFTFISILIEYIKLLIFPLHLYIDKPYVWYNTLFTWQGISGLLIIFASLIAAGFSFFRKKILFVGIFWFFICLAPFIGLIPLNSTYLEHWLYFAMFGLLIIFVHCFDRIKVLKLKILIIYALSIILTLYSIRVIARNSDWSDEIRFYQNELVYNPDSQRTHSNLALKYFIDKRYPESIQHYKIAISLLDSYPECHNNLGVMYMEMGMYGLAEKEFYSALKINPNFIYSINGLSVLYTNKSQTNKAKKLVKLRNILLAGSKITHEEINKISNISN